MRVVGGGGGGRAEFRRHQKDIMSLRIQCHGPRAALGGDACDARELFGRVLVHDRQCAFPVGAEGELCCRVEAIRVHTVTDGRRGQHFAGVGAHHRHHLVVAADEEAAMFRVHGHARGPFARRQWPARGHRELAGINLHDFAFVLQVVVDVTLAVRHRELRLSSQGDGSCRGSRRGVNRGGIAAVAIEREDAFRSRVVEDRIRTIARRRGPQGLKRLEVENRDGVRAALLVKPRPNSGARAMPWTPSVPGMSPTTA